MALRSRKWLLTIFLNDYIVKDFDFNTILKYDIVIRSPLHNVPSPHYHIILQHKNAISFDTLKRLLPYAHIEQQFGTNQQAYDYLFHKNDLDKEELSESDIVSNIDLGGWLDNKEETKEDIGRDIMRDIEESKTLWEVLKKNPSYWRDVSRIKDLWNIYQVYCFRVQNPGFNEIQSKKEVEDAIRREQTEIKEIFGIL